MLYNIVLIFAILSSIIAAIFMVLLFGATIYDIYIDVTEAIEKRKKVKENEISVHFIHDER